MMIDPREARNVTCLNSRGGRKIAYATNQEAKQALKQKLARGFIKKPFVRIYACQYHGWHIGHLMDRNA
jgi:hypothetical protein